ncbi:MAG: cobalamin biosynthesis protein CbiG [Methanosaeta sp. PtaU1.Bin112]|nr:MAG: cobalamin biosynthesis protein CbiG [Methanosaeta sp. PtaU1.Bin112]
MQEGYSPEIVPYEKDKLDAVLEKYELVLGIMAVGIAVRTLCGHLSDKWTDRPVVAVNSALSCAVPVVGGHHGANDLARFLASRLGLFAAVTTATDSSGRPCLEEVAAGLGADIVNKESSKAINLAFLKEDVPVIRLKGPKIVVVDEDVAVLKERGLVVGIGARRGVSASEVLAAIDESLSEAGRKRDDIAILATAWLKSEEEGMRQAANELGRELIFLSREILNSQSPSTASRAQDLGLCGVAEPAVLALASRLISAKKAYGRVTIAIGQ